MPKPRDEGAYNRCSTTQSPEQLDRYAEWPLVWRLTSLTLLHGLMRIKAAQLHNTEYLV